MSENFQSRGKLYKLKDITLIFIIGLFNMF